MGHICSVKQATGYNRATVKMVYRAFERENMQLVVKVIADFSSGMPVKSLFLTGYGLSVSVRNTRLVFKQGLDPFSKDREVLELPASTCQFDKVVIQGRGYVSTEALERLA